MRTLNVGIESNKEIFSKNSLFKNVLITLMGQSLPIVVGLFTIPGLIHQIGSEKFGVLSIVWVLIGYFGLFDLGISRALTRKIARDFESGAASVKKTFLSASLFTFFLGVLGGATLFFLSEWLSIYFLKVSDHLKMEVLYTFQLMSVAIPFVISSAIMKGSLEALNRFDIINKIQIPLGSLIYGLPFLVALKTNNLLWLIGSLIFVRLLMWLFFSIYCFVLFNRVQGEWDFDFSPLKELVRFGFWITSSNIIGPLIAYVDRLLIGAIVSVSAVAHYMVPIEMVLKIWIIPTAVTSVMFPAFSYLHDKESRAKELYFRSLKFLFILLFPIGFILSVFGREIISFWIGNNFALESAVVLRWLGLGIWMNCLGSIPLAYIQARGRPDIPAKLYVFEFPVYVLLLIFLLKNMGVEGAAIAWVVRVGMDALLLALISQNQLLNYRKWVHYVSWAILLDLWIFILTWQSIYLRIGFTLLGLSSFYIFVWFYLLNTQDRLRVVEKLFNIITQTKSPVPSWQDERKDVKVINKIGIALAAYDPNPLFLREQLESLLSQEYQDWICVITFDSPLAELFEKEKKDFPSHQGILEKILSNPKFVVVENNSRLGVKANFSKALRLIAQYQVDAIAFCDQDDVWYSRKLSVLRSELMKKPNGSLVHSDMKLTQETPEGTKLFAESCWNFEKRNVHYQTPIHMILRNCVTGAASLFDVELAKNYWNVPLCGPLHDHWIALMASFQGGVYPISQILYEYRQHESNVVGAISPNTKVIIWPKDRNEMTIFIRKVSEGWQNTQQIAHSLKNNPSIEFSGIKWLFLRPLLGGFEFVIFAVLMIKDDPVFSFTCFAKGLGKMLSFLPTVGYAPNKKDELN